MSKLLAIVLTMAVAVGALAQDNHQESNPYLTESGKLRRTLKLTLTGRGVKAPQTWLIEPSGKWTATTSGEKSKEKSRSGYLSAAQLAALAKDLEDYRLLELPREVSQRTDVPDQLYALSFGDVTSTLELVAGDALASSDPARADPLAIPSTRFAALVRGIQSRLK